MLLPILLKAKLVELMELEIWPELSLELYRPEDHCNYRVQATQAKGSRSYQRWLVSA